MISIFRKIYKWEVRLCSKHSVYTAVTIVVTYIIIIIIIYELERVRRKGKKLISKFRDLDYQQRFIKS